MNTATVRAVRTVVRTYGTASADVGLHTVNTALRALGLDEVTAADLVGVEGITRDSRGCGVGYFWTGRALDAAERHERLSALSKATDGGMTAWKLASARLWKRWVKEDVARDRDFSAENVRLSERVAIRVR